MRFSKFVIWLCFIVFAQSVKAQVLNFRFDNIGQQFGIISSGINGITQDSKGFLWLATSRGLFRFDHYQMKQIPLLTTDGYEVEYILKVFEYNNKLWLLFREGIGYFDFVAEQFVMVQKKTDYSDVVIYDDCLWVGGKQGISSFRLESFQSKKIPQCMVSKNLDSLEVSTLYLSSASTMWICCENGNMYVYDSNKQTCSFVLKSGRKASYAEDDNGYLWLASDKGLKKVELKNKKVTPVDIFPEREGKMKNSWVTSLTYDSINQYLWVGTFYNGLYVLDVKTNDIICIFKNELDNDFTLNSNLIHNLYIDAHSNLWVNTIAGGLSKVDLKQKPFTLYYRNQGGANAIDLKNVRSVFLDSKQRLWMGSSSGLNCINQFNGKKQFYKYNSEDVTSISGGIIGGVSEDINGNIWAISWDGFLNKFNENTGNFKRYKGGGNILKGWGFRDIFCDEDGNVWLLSIRQGLERFNPIALESEIFSLPKDFVYRSLYSHGDKLWVGGDNMFASFNKTTKNIQLYTTEKIVDRREEITAFCAEGKNKIWIGGTYLYYFLLQNDSLVKVSDKRLNVGRIHSIYRDDNERLWLGTEKGIFVFKPVFDGDSLRLINFHVITKEDGLLSNETIWNAHFKDDKSGRIYLGLIGGLVSFIPEQITFNTAEVVPEFTGLKIFNEEILPGKVFSNKVILEKSISYTQSITLSYKQNDFSISFASLHFVEPLKNKYRYILEGYNTNWVEIAAGENEVSYMNLPPGKYTFKVKSANGDGVWGEKTKQLKINIRPPFWHTWLFRIGFVIFATTLILSVYYYRINSLTKRQIELEKIIRDRTLQIKNRNNQLIKQSDALQESNIVLKSQHEKLIELNDKLNKNSEELSHVNRELKEINSTKDKLFSIIAHDLRNPFMLVKNQIEILFENFEEFSFKDKKNMLSELKDSSNATSELLENLLNWSRIQSDKINLKPQKLNVYALVKEVVFYLNIMAKEKQIKIVNTCDEKIYLHADKNVMHTVLRNLLANAIKFSYEKTQVLIKVEKTDSKVRLSVEDYGVGMGVTSLKNLFTRKDKITEGTHGEKGSGLGLLICKELLDKCKGKIEVESTKKKGSIFTIVLPDRTNKDQSDFIELNQKLVEEEYIEENPDLSVLAEKVVLVVEDNDTLRKNMSDYLAQYCKVLQASNGAKALQKVIKESVDIIVSDIMMPEMNGLDLCKQLKSDIKTSHIPIILLTANISDAYRIKGYKYEADDYLTKPFSNEILMVRLASIFCLRQKMKEQSFNTVLGITDDEINKDTPDEKFLHLVVNIIHKNIDSPDLTVEMLSKELNLNRSHFYKKIKTLTNVSPNELIRNIRLDKAAKLIAGGQHNVSEAMYATGFVKSSYFAQCFKKKFGVLPSEYFAQES